MEAFRTQEGKKGVFLMSFAAGATLFPLLPEVPGNFGDFFNFFLIFVHKKIKIEQFFILLLFLFYHIAYYLFSKLSGDGEKQLKFKKIDSFFLILGMILIVFLLASNLLELKIHIFT